MCGAHSVGTTPTISMNATSLPGGGASTTTTSVAGASPRVGLPSPPADGATGPDSLGPLLAELEAAVESLRQALGGGAFDAAPHQGITGPG